jgi:hypothetical protein
MMRWCTLLSTSSSIYRVVQSCPPHSP